jgi:hypothetical protein
VIVAAASTSYSLLFSSSFLLFLGEAIACKGRTRPGGHDRTTARPHGMSRPYAIRPHLFRPSPPASPSRSLSHPPERFQN